MPVTKLTPTFNLEQERIEALKQLIPEAVSDGKIDWEALKQALGELVEEQGAEHFGLSWTGKQEARRLAVTPSQGTLVPVLGEGIDENTTKNLFIEGDNLEVLKLLQKSYAGKVKLIYIDPPYNTGNDFIYKDDYSEPTEDYLRKTQQADEAGKLLTTNPKTSGRFHSNWLSMMYPRLRLAKNLLRDDGVIFVSIDDNEVHNLRHLMNEIFGEENFIATVIWERADSPRMDAKHFSFKHDYVLCVSKTVDLFNIIRSCYDDDEIPEHFNKVDENNRKYYLKPLRAMGGQGETRESRPNLYYPIIAPDGSEVYPKLQNGSDGAWRWSREKLQSNFSRIEWTISNGQFTPNYRIYSDESKGKPPETILFSEDVGSNRTATQELKIIFDDEKVFDSPKPEALIREILHFTTQDLDIVLDFFSGSSTTAHAVLELNKEDGGNRRFIMVQLPEPTNNPEYPTIAEIGKERIRRVIKKIKEEQAQQLDLAEGEPQDLGFRVYKLARSNLKIWQDYKGDDIQALQTQLFEHENKLVDGWTEEKVITELQLLEGFPLDSKVELAPDFQSDKVFCVSHEDIEHHLFICLAPKLHINTIQDVRLLPEEDVFICLDTALDDRGKLMLADSPCNVKTI